MGADIGDYENRKLSVRNHVLIEKHISKHDKLEGIRRLIDDIAN